MTSVQVPRRVRERVAQVTPQLYEQDRLSESWLRSLQLKGASSTTTTTVGPCRRRAQPPRHERLSVRIRGGVSGDTLGSLAAAAHWTMEELKQSVECLAHAW